MELKMFLRVIQRRWPIILVVPVLVAAFAVFQERTHEPTYTSTLRAAVIRHPDPELSSEDAYYNYVASEFAIDDLVEAVRGNVFAAAIHARATELDTDPSRVDRSASVSAERRHRIIDVHIESHDAAVAELIAQAAATELEERAFEYLGLTEAESSAIVQIVERPGGAAANTRQLQMLLVLQVLAAAGAGVLIAFLIDYLDDTLYDADTAALTMRLPHLVTIPRDRGA